LGLEFQVMPKLCQCSYQGRGLDLRGQDQGCRSWDQATVPEDKAKAIKIWPQGALRPRHGLTETISSPSGNSNHWQWCWQLDGWSRWRDYYAPKVGLINIQRNMLSADCLLYATAVQRITASTCSLQW